jgi:beta-mannosidase
LLVSAVEEDDEIIIWATSDVNKSISADFKMNILDFSGTSVFSEDFKILLKEQESRQIAQYHIQDLCKDADSKFKVFMDFSLKNDELKSRNQYFFSPFKELVLRKPEIKYEVSEQDGDICISIGSETLAPFIWIRHGDIHGTWSDNGFHLIPGETKSLVFFPRYEKPTVKDIKAVIKIHDLYDSYC